jgi:hypothetical protein
MIFLRIVEDIRFCRRRKRKFAAKRKNHMVWFGWDNSHKVRKTHAELIASSNHITDYSIHFFQVPTAIPTRSFACYYKIAAYTHGDPMYVKLVNNFYYFTTDQMGQQLKFQPQIDQHEIQQENWIAKLDNYLLNAGLSFTSIYKVYYNYQRLQIPAQTYLDQKLKSVLANRFSGLNTCLEVGIEAPLWHCHLRGKIINHVDINVPGSAECSSGCKLNDLFYKYNEEEQNYTLYAHLKNTSDNSMLEINLNENSSIADSLGFDVQDVAITTPSKVAKDLGISGLEGDSISQILDDYSFTPGWSEIYTKLGKDEYALLDTRGMSQVIWGSALSFGVDAVLWTVIQ